MADQAALTDTDYGALIQGAAASALSPFCDPNDDDWLDAAADQVRDAVLTALADEGLAIVLVGDVSGVVDEIDRLNTKLGSGINLTRGIPTTSGGNYPTPAPIQNNAGANP